VSGVSFTVRVKTDAINKAPKHPFELYDFFYGVDDGQIEAEIVVVEDIKVPGDLMRPTRPGETRSTGPIPGDHDYAN
jgi:hypothetical protein